MVEFAEGEVVNTNQKVDKMFGTSEFEYGIFPKGG